METELKLVEKEKTKKLIKPKIEPIGLTQIGEVWRLVESSLLNGGLEYPDASEDPKEVIQSILYNYMQQPNFCGLMARLNKKPMGLILGHAAERNYGRPRRFASIWCFWIEPQFRKNGTGLLLWREYSERFKKAGIQNWESLVQPNLEKILVREMGVPVKKLQALVGGRL